MAAEEAGAVRLILRQVPAPLLELPIPLHCLYRNNAFAEPLKEDLPCLGRGFLDNRSKGLLGPI